MVIICSMASSRAEVKPTNRPASGSDTTLEKAFLGGGGGGARWALGGGPEELANVAPPASRDDHHALTGLRPPGRHPAGRLEASLQALGLPHGLRCGLAGDTVQAIERFAGLVA